MLKLTLMVTAIVVSGLSLLDVSPADDGSSVRTAVAASSQPMTPSIVSPTSPAVSDDEGIDDLTGPTAAAESDESTNVAMDPLDRLRHAFDVASIHAALEELGSRAGSADVAQIVESRLFDPNEDGSTRGHLLYLWSRVGGSTVADLAARVIDTETNAPLRRAAVRTLGRRNIPFDGERLVRVLEESRDVVERRFAASGLAMGPLTPRAIAALRRAIEDPTADPVLRKNVASTLAIKSKSRSRSESEAATTINRDAWNRMSEDTRQVVVDPDVAKRIGGSDGQ